MTQETALSFEPPKYIKLWRKVTNGICDLPDWMGGSYVSNRAIKKSQSEPSFRIQAPQIPEHSKSVGARARMQHEIICDDILTTDTAPMRSVVGQAGSTSLAADKSSTIVNIDDHTPTVAYVQISNTSPVRDVYLSGSAPLPPNSSEITELGDQTPLVGPPKENDDLDGSPPEAENSSMSQA